MSKVIVYTTRYCPHCARAKNLLKKKGISFEEIDVTNDSQKRQDAEKRYGMMTVPIIVIGDKWVGGADELHALEQAGKLDKLV